MKLARRSRTWIRSGRYVNRINLSGLRSTRVVNFSAASRTRFGKEPYDPDRIIFRTHVEARKARYRWLEQVASEQPALFLRADSGSVIYEYLLILLTMIQVDVLWIETKELVQPMTKSRRDRLEQLLMLP